MSNLLGIITLTLAPLKPANFVCDLDDCHMADALHIASEQLPQQDRWSWMNHDLALARKAALRGQHAEALRLVTNLDQVMRSNLSQLLIDRGADHVIGLHEALRAISVDCKGHPLAPLSLTMDPIARHRTSDAGVKTPAK